MTEAEQRDQNLSPESDSLKKGSDSMQKIITELQSFDKESRARILRAAATFYGIMTPDGSWS